MYFRKFLIPLFLMALCALAACTPRSVNRTMDRAELLADSIPDSAYRLMASIDPAKIHSASSRARYALLRTYTLYRTDRPIDSDSLITIAVKYYAGNPDTHILPLTKAHFLRGYILRDLGELRSAMDDAMIAHVLAEQSPGNYLWQAKTAELISDIYNFSQTPGEDIPYNELAIDRYRKAGRHRNVLFSLSDKALSLANIGKYREGAALLDSIIDLARSQTPIDSTLLSYSLGHAFRIYSRLDDYDRADSIICELKELDNMEVMSSDMCSVLAISRVSQERFKEADSLLNIASTNAYEYVERDFYHKARAMYHKKLGQYDQLIADLDSLSKVHYKYMGTLYAQPTLTAQRDFYHQQALHEKEHKRKITIFSIAIIALFIIALVVIINHNKMRLRLKNAEIDAKIADIMILSDQYVATKQQLEENIRNDFTQQSRLNNEIQSLFKNNWMTINSLCVHFFDRPDNQTIRKQILNEIEKTLHSLINEDNLATIENSINLYQNNIIQTIREECTWIKPQDITLITLIIAGFSPKSICVIMDLKLKTFYTRRSRLIERLRSENLEFADLLTEN